MDKGGEQEKGHSFSFTSLPAWHEDSKRSNKYEHTKQSVIAVVVVMLAVVEAVPSLHHHIRMSGVELKGKMEKKANGENYSLCKAGEEEWWGDGANTTN